VAILTTTVGIDIWVEGISTSSVSRNTLIEDIGTLLECIGEETIEEAIIVDKNDINSTSV